MRRIDVCLSPELIQLYPLQEHVVVVADVLRATSCIVTALAHGAHHIMPLVDREACKKMKQKGYVLSGEYNGEKIAGFDKGNSPFEYMDSAVKGIKIALKTTNGTRAIQEAKKAHKLLIGSFLNLDAVVDQLRDDARDVVIFCAGWKGRVNMEDSLFAGAVVEALKEQTTPGGDAPIIAQQLYRTAKNDMLEFLKNTSHVQRLTRLNLQRDIAFCLSPNRYTVVPRLQADQTLR